MQSVVDIARGLRVQTVAEFVGSALVLEQLRRLGVDYGQGYYLGVPRAVDEALPVPAGA